MLSDDRPTDPAWLPIFSNKEHFMAMEDCGFSKKDIRHVVGQLYEVFDLNSVEDAKEKYHSSPY